MARSTDPQHRRSFYRRCTSTQLLTLSWGPADSFSYLQQDRTSTNTRLGRTATTITWRREGNKRCMESLLLSSLGLPIQTLRSRSHIFSICLPPALAKICCSSPRWYPVCNPFQPSSCSQPSSVPERQRARPQHRIWNIWQDHPCCELCTNKSK
jgi:hypothetical protein